MLRQFQVQGRSFIIDSDSGRWAPISEAVPAQPATPPSFPPHHANVTGSDAELDALLETLRYGFVQRARPEVALDTIIVKVTNRCNEACKYCYDAKGEPAVDLNLDQTLDRIVEVLPLCGDELQLIFHGGEPLLRHKELEQFMRKVTASADALGRKLFVSMQTNGSILNDAVMDFLQRWKVHLGISLDGTPEIHDDLRIMRNGSGTYRLFKRNYDKYRDYMVTHAGIMAVVTSRNVKRLDEVARHIRDLGFQAFSMTIFDTNGKGRFMRQLIPSAEDYIESVKGLVADIEVGEFDSMSIGNLTMYLDNLLLDTKRHMCLPGNGPCGAASRLLSLESNGDIASCDIVHDPDLLLGHMSQSTLADALNSPTAAKIRNRHTQLELCQSCSWLSACGGTCLGRSTMTELNEFDCRVTRELLEHLVYRISSSDALLDWYEKHTGRVIRVAEEA